jgi:hypothetical protein
VPTSTAASFERTTISLGQVSLLSAEPSRTVRADLHRRQFRKDCLSERKRRLDRSVEIRVVGVVGQFLPFAAQECAISYTEFARMRQEYLSGIAFGGGGGQVDFLVILVSGVLEVISQ